MLLRVIRGSDPGAFKLVGELDVASVPILEKAVQEQIAGGGPVVLDLSEVSFMDSSGLHFVLRTAKALNGGGPLALLHPTHEVRRLFDMALPPSIPGLEVID